MGWHGKALWGVDSGRSARVLAMPNPILHAAFTRPINMRSPPVRPLLQSWRQKSRKASAIHSDLLDLSQQYISVYVMRKFLWSDPCVESIVVHSCLICDMFVWVYFYLFFFFTFLVIVKIYNKKIFKLENWNIFIIKIYYKMFYTNIK